MKISADILCRQALSDGEKESLKEIDKSIRLVEKEITKLRDINFEKIDFSKV